VEMKATMEKRERKQKKRLNSVDEQKSIVKKKRKVEDLVKTTKNKPSNRESVNGATKSIKEKGTTKIKPPKQAKLENLSKPSAKSTEGKTMDYKQYHLKKMKEKWKSSKGKRNRRPDAGNTASPKKPTVKSIEDSSRSKRIIQQFGVCDFSELEHYWNEFAAFTLTSVEREQLELEPKKLVVNTKSRKPYKFFQKHIPDWTRWTEEELPNGSPNIIIVCPSALRAVELNRELAPFKGDKCRVAKLFKKEKAKDQAEHLAKSVVNIAIGTPHRIDLLLAHNSLKLDECRVIALDWSHEDAKKRRLITIPELRLDVMQLFKKHFIPLLKERGDVSLFLF